MTRRSRQERVAATELARRQFEAEGYTCKPVLPEEERCANAFKRYLEEKGIACTWSGVDPIPPDVQFNVTRPNGVTETWAVEVTGLFRSAGWSAKEVSDVLFKPAILKLCKELNEELELPRRRGYSLNLLEPMRARAFRDLKRRIREYVLSRKTEEEALDYPEARSSALSSFHQDANAAGFEEAAIDRTEVTIRPSARRAGIIPFFADYRVFDVRNARTRRGDVAATLRFAIKRLLKAKLPVVEEVQGYDRKIILVWSGTPFVEASDVKKRFLALKPKGVDGIFLMDGEFFLDKGTEEISVILDNGLGLG